MKTTGAISLMPVVISLCRDIIHVIHRVVWELHPPEYVLARAKNKKPAGDQPAFIVIYAQGLESESKFKLRILEH